VLYGWWVDVRVDVRVDADIIESEMCTQGVTAGWSVCGFVGGLRLCVWVCERAEVEL
jgi:hypothetical protein